VAAAAASLLNSDATNTMYSLTPRAVVSAVSAINTFFPPKVASPHVPPSTACVAVATWEVGLQGVKDSMSAMAPLAAEERMQGEWK
jgi:hypothetical protein